MYKKLMALILVLFFFVSFVHSAELLVKAKPHWMDSLSQEEIDEMSEEQHQSYEARSQIGDIIVVRPDGWEWGGEECLPNFVVIKIPDLTVEETKKYEESLIEIVDDGTEHGDMVMLEKRKYQIPRSVIISAKQQNKNSITIEQAQKDSFIVNIIDKSE